MKIAERLPIRLVEELAEAGLDPRTVYDAAVATLAEDLPGEDVTSVATVDPAAVSVAEVVARSAGVVAGLAVAEIVFWHVAGGDVEIDRRTSDGAHVDRGDVLLTLRGRTLPLLTAERTALNFLCHLSGIATTTAQWVATLSGTPVRVRDTRKTTPHLRALEKYAVRCGGGENHRATLSDQALVKDNHVLAAGGVAPAYQAVLSAYPGLPVQVEVTTLDQLRELLAAGADQVLLDNMSTEQMAEAVRIAGGRAALEASGGLTVDRAREVAATGVHYLAVGALTHSAPVLDLGFDLRP